MNILQVSLYDNLGGAARIAWNLHLGFQKKGHSAWMAVHEKISDNSHVVCIPETKPRLFITRPIYFLAKAAEKYKIRLFHHNLSGLFMRFADPLRYWERYKGKEDFDFPESRLILKLTQQHPDLVHLHNLHLNYFDLSYLPELSNQLPTVMSLHDMWTMTGHCAHSMHCERWKIGCGNCPQLDSYPAMDHDQTAFNWQRKKEIYQNSKLYVVAPSEWLLNLAKQSNLASGIVKSKVIPNAIDFKHYYPGDKNLARLNLRLPLDVPILLFVSASGNMNKNSYKDYFTIKSAIEILAKQYGNRKMLLIALGGKKSVQRIGDIEIRYLPYEKSPERLANYYQASDIYLHAARAETFGLAIVEAQACGLPVIATATGGIPEIVFDGITGLLTEQENPLDMANKIIQLLEDHDLRDTMAIAALNNVHQKYGLDNMIDCYLDFYQEILNEWKA